MEELMPQRATKGSFKPQTKCRNGHPYPKNATRDQVNGSRRCEICRAAARKRANARQLWDQGESRWNVPAIGDELEAARRTAAAMSI